MSIRGWQLAGAGLVVLALVAAGAFALRPRGSTEAVVSTCLRLEASDEQQAAAEEALCDRRALDEARRAPVPAGAVQDSSATDIYKALNKAICHPPGGSICRRGSRPQPATDADVGVVRQIIADLRFGDAVVRLSGPGDPAPDGAVVYGVRLGGSYCAVSYVQMGVGAYPGDVRGLLPNGQCLA
ncbi:hypothetical protein [Actinoplanes friuliensis]|uniref:hypothetical protein n=1 Tax=Actinoplanes friuliensis TaxID=196914 RepID=UPI00059F3BA8|nr:hypothetical protein [Actinoplanes friuliensis]